MAENIGAGIANSAVQGAFGLIGQGVQYAINKKLMAQQNQYNIDMWNMQNEYNSPEQQMKRFQQAGLSPQLMYGQGSNGNASSAPVQGVPSIDVASPISKLGNVFDAIKNAQQIKMNQEAINQASLKTFVDSISMQDMLARWEARKNLFKNLPDFPGKDNRVDVFSHFDPFGHGHVIDSELSYFYNKQFQNDYATSHGQAREWHYRGNLADQGINVRDPWWGRLTFNTLGTALNKAGIKDSGDGLLYSLFRWLGLTK